MYFTKTKLASTVGATLLVAILLSTPAFAADAGAATLTNNERAAQSAIAGFADLRRRCAIRVGRSDVGVQRIRRTTRDHRHLGRQRFRESWPHQPGGRRDSVAQRAFRAARHRGRTSLRRPLECQSLERCGQSFDTEPAGCALRSQETSTWPRIDDGLPARNSHSRKPRQRPFAFAMHSGATAFCDRARSDASARPSDHQVIEHAPHEIPIRVRFRSAEGEAVDLLRRDEAAEVLLTGCGEVFDRAASNSMDRCRR